MTPDHVSGHHGCEAVWVTQPDGVEQACDAPATRVVQFEDDTLLCLPAVRGGSVGLRPVPRRTIGTEKMSAMRCLGCKARRSDQPYGWVDEKWATLGGGVHQIIGRLIDGQYPNWRPFLEIPPKAATLTIDVESFIRAVTQVSAVAVPSSKIPNLVRLEFGEDGISVSLATDDSAWGSGFVKARNWQGEPLALGVVHRYLLDALACLNSPTAVLSLTGTTKPLVLRAADEDGELLNDGYGHVLMPRRLAETRSAA